MNWITTSKNGLATFYTNSCIGGIKVKEIGGLEIGSRKVTELHYDFIGSVPQLAENWLKEGANNLLQPLYFNSDHTANTLLGTIKVVGQPGYFKIYLNRKRIATTDRTYWAEDEIRRVARQLLKEIES